MHIEEGVRMIPDSTRTTRGDVAAQLDDELGRLLRERRPRQAEQGTQDDALRRAGHELRAARTILVVEDEEDLRRLLQAMLEGAGYQVVDAGSGAKALERVREHQGPIDLVFTDVTLPDMDGQELARKMRELRPGTRIIYCSGFMPEDLARRGAPLEPAAVFIPKPLGLDELLQVIEDVISGRR